jgi:uncharacterized protein YeaO (DUF488 family)
MVCDTIYRFERMLQLENPDPSVSMHTIGSMPIKTKRWDDPRDADDGFRLLVTRYRPRALPKADETWDAWQPNLGPSKELHAAVYGKKGLPITWDVYRRRYLTEMRTQSAAIEELAKRVAAGETITLLCSSQCVRESRCHRSLLKQLVEAKRKRAD